MSINLSLAQNVLWRQTPCWRWAVQRTTTRTVDNTVPVRELVRSCRRITVKMSGDELNMNRGTVRLILAEAFGIRKSCAKMSPRNLTQQQRHAWLSVCADLLEQMVADPELIDRVITWRELVFPICSRDQTSMFKAITKTKESTHVPVKSEMHACVLLWFHGCSQIVGSCCTDSQSILLHKNSSKTEERRYVGSSKHGEELNPDWWQCASPCGALCRAVFDVSMHYGESQPPYSLDLAPCDISLISKSKISSERVPLWVNGRHPEGCNAGRELHPTCFVPGMPQTMAAPLRKVCAGTRDLTRKWPHCSWWINKIFLNQAHYFIVRPGKIKLSCLFEVTRHKAIQSNAVPWFAFVQKNHAPTIYTCITCKLTALTGCRAAPHVTDISKSHKCS
jgi:hypothetical protein